MKDEFCRLELLLSVGAEGLDPETPADGSTRFWSI